MRQETYVIGMWFMTVALAGNGIDVDCVDGEGNVQRFADEGQRFPRHLAYMIDVLMYIIHSP
jgi:hypothetical protein